jgi:hypothetical protein
VIYTDSSLRAEEKMVSSNLPTKRYQSLGQKIPNLLTGEAFEFDIHTEI